MDYPQETVPANAEQLQTLLFSGDTSMKAAEATVEAMRQEVEVARQGWIPKLSLGYRRNTDGSEASNGFLVGVAFPIYSTGKRVKAATARRAAAELEMENTRARLQGEVKPLQRAPATAEDPLHLRRHASRRILAFAPQIRRQRNNDHDRLLHRGRQNQPKETLIHRD